MGIKKILDSFEGFRKWTADIEKIELEKKKAFIEGSNASAEKFVSVSSDMSDQLEKVIREKQEDLNRISQESAERERMIREQANKTIQELNETHDTKCKFCRTSMENERMRFKARQMYLAEITNKLDLLQQKQKQHAGSLVKQADIALSALAIIVSSKAAFITFEEEFDKIIKEAQPYLSMELQSGVTEKFMAFDKALDTHIMTDAPKQIETKKDK
jgi:Fe-S cluster assembly scaffold protein SufB